MKTSIFLTCLALVLVGAVDSLAQFTPITAKIKITTYTPQSDGTSQAKVTHKGFYYRSSHGDTVTTNFHVDDNGVKDEAGRTTYREVSTGKIYSITHISREAKVRQKLSLPILPLTTRPPANLISGEKVINGLDCIGMTIRNGDGSSGGTSWRSVSIDLDVRTEFDLGGGRHMVKELYDIQFTEPSLSKFGVPSNYTVDQSACSGCD